MIAVGLVSVGLFAFIRLAGRGYEYSTAYGHKAKAGRLLQQLLEEVSFVPFREIERVCGDSLQEDWVDIPQAFYPKTRESIAAFRSAQGKGWKDFSHSATMKGAKNHLGQIVLLTIRCSISWRLRGKVANTSSPLRSIRDGTILANPDALMGATP